MTNLTSILFIWKVRNELKEYLRTGLKELPVELIFPNDLSDKKLLALCRDAEIIVGWRPSPPMLSAADNLALFINPGAGIQHLIERFDAANLNRPVTIVNGHGNNYFTAQHTVSILLAWFNKIIPHHQWMKEGKWRTGDREAKSEPLRNKQIGLLGYGHVNQMVHRFLSGFDVSFAALRKNPSKTPKPKVGPKLQMYSPADLASFLETSDVLIAALPLTSSTKGLIGKRELQLLGPDGLLVNVGRGKVVNEKALYDALKTKTIKGAAIDVWYDYEVKEDENGKKHPYRYPFHELDNIILSPHRAASPMDDLGRWNDVIENIRRYVTGQKAFLNEVDLVEGY